LFFKGSTKIGFSIKPKIKKVWMAFGPLSDLDLAIVDSHFFQIVDDEVGQWEWNADNRGRMFRDQRLLRGYQSRAYHKGKYDCLRFFDLPKIKSMERLNECLESAPVEKCCGVKRTLKAFVFRDWWGVCKRYDYDIYCLLSGLKQQPNPFPAGADQPRPYEEVDDEAEEGEENIGAIRAPIVAKGRTSSTDQQCPVCRTTLQMMALGFSYVCPQCSPHLVMD
jgi:hypothetical protein